MKRSRGTKHRTATVNAPADSPFLAEAKRLVTTCAVEGVPQTGQYSIPTPHGTVRLTMRAEMLVHAPGAPKIVRPS